MAYFDLKIGMLCNNECIHCVVANRRQRAERTPDMKYAEIIRYFKEIKLEEYTGLVITGGEPTVFPFLGRLLKYNSLKSSINLFSNLPFVCRHICM